MLINPNMLLVNGTKLSTILSHYRHIGVLVNALKNVHHDWYALEAWDELRGRECHAKVVLELMEEQDD